MMSLASSLHRLPLNVRAAAAIEKLDDRERQVLALLLLEKLNPLETAGALRLTVGQVNESFRRAVDAIIAETRDSRSARRAA